MHDLTLLTVCKLIAILRSWTWSRRRRTMPTRRRRGTKRRPTPEKTRGRQQHRPVMSRDDFAKEIVNLKTESKLKVLLLIRVGLFTITTQASSRSSPFAQARAARYVMIPSSSRTSSVVIRCCVTSDFLRTPKLTVKLQKLDGVSS